MTAGTFAWPDDSQGAVSLTYDDGLPVHLSVVAPLLDRHGLRATFYPMIQSDLQLHPEGWKALAAAGHELGNHSVFHPCRQRSPNPYKWLDDRYDLAHYSLDQMRAELEIANLVLHLLDDREARSYGCTCGDLSVGTGVLEVPLQPIFTDLFVAARGTVTNEAAHPGPGLDLYNIGCIDVAGRRLPDLQRLVEGARLTGGWAVFVVHGIGAGTHELYLEAGVHEEFVGWLAQQTRIWTAPVRAVAAYVRDHVSSLQRLGGAPQA
ncbi:MAG: polysaccharide deacetylase family protein [Anaerolineales bacterium]